MAQDDFGQHVGRDGTMPLSQKGWLVQTLQRELDRIFTIAHLDADSINRSLVGALGVFMMTYPVTTFIQYLRNGILLISPLLLLMFLAGIVGLGLSRAQRESTPVMTMRTEKSDL